VGKVGNLQGVIDMHIHSNPDPIKRPLDEYEITIQAREAGYHGIVLEQAIFFDAKTLVPLKGPKGKASS
jgi:hypothetical protein